MEEIMPPDHMWVIPFIYRVLKIAGGAGVLPSTVPLILL